MTRTALAPAKVNLALHVTGRRGDGYHLLDSLVVFADYGDRLTVAPADELTLEITGPFAAGLAVTEDNLVLRAARLFPGSRGARLGLEKNLPVASGIGGGSADAAAALHLLSAHWATDLPDLAATISLGADVPVCLAGRATRMRGIGEDLAPVPAFPPLDAVLVNPGVAVSTPDVFRRLSTRDTPPLPDLPEGGRRAAWMDWLDATRNDLEAPARALAPGIGEVIDALATSAGCRLARMSGSGATCFGLFGSGEAADSAAAALAGAHPEWWVRKVMLG
jgi:4-diphosphocytidyl-2-C-methyl-D-erythritol kinase